MVTIMNNATMMEETVAKMIQTLHSVLNVNVLKELEVVRMLTTKEMVIAMMETIIIDVNLMGEIVAAAT